MDANQHKAIILIEIGRIKDAIKILTSQLADDPNDAISLSLLGLCFLREKKIQSGRDQVHKALCSDPEHPSVLYSFAQLQLYDRDRKGALATISKAITSDPNEPIFFLFKGKIHLSLGQLSEAITQFSLGMEVDPENEYCLSMLIVGCLFNDQKDRASVLSIEFCQEACSFTH